MNKVQIIAELGINHNGSFVAAFEMINAAKTSGVGIVKFQHYDALKLLGPASPYLEYAASCQFSKRMHEELKAYCDSIGMEYLVSVFDIQDIPWADGLCKRHKVASRMNSNKEFVAALRATGKPLIISTSNPRDAANLDKADYMYCITEYPTPLSKMYHLPCNERLGLSSHCPNILPTIAAVAQGARVVEHHVTFSRDYKGCDQSSSITFSELEQLNRVVNILEVI